MNSLQIDFLNAVNNAKRIDSEVALNKAKLTETERKSDYLETQATGQRLSNHEFKERLANLARRILNEKYKLDMDNAMLYNTVDWWVNDGKKLSDHHNRMFNTYWNTSGNLPRQVNEALGAIRNIATLPADSFGPFAEFIFPKKAAVKAVATNTNKGLIK